MFVLLAGRFLCIQEPHSSHSSEAERKFFFLVNVEREKIKEENVCLFFIIAGFESRSHEGYATRSAKSVFRGNQRDLHADIFFAMVVAAYVDIEFVLFIKRLAI